MDGEWQDIASAPYNEPVEVRVGEGMIFVARLIPDASFKEDETTCAQWQAEHEGEHPPCWSEGCCWASNEEEVASLQPLQWRLMNGEWRPIETASAVGKKRLLFRLANGRMVVGWRLAGAAQVMPEYGNMWFLATGWQPLPPPPMNTKPVPVEMGEG